MTRFLFLFFILLYSIQTNAQDAKKHFNKGLQMVNDGDFANASLSFTKAIDADKIKKNYSAYYQRGICYIKLKQYEKAEKDVEFCLQQKPKDVSLLTMRAFIKKGLTQYEQSLQDFSAIIKIDPYNMEAYYNRGVIYAYTKEYDSACADFMLSKNAIPVSEFIVSEYCNTSEKKIRTLKHTPQLTRRTKDKTYGYTSANPIKVGEGILGPAASEHAYLDLLRDEKNMPIEYERVGKCCPHKSIKRGEGLYYLDKFDITFLTSTNAKERATLFLSHHEYAAPMIPYNLQTIPREDSLFQSPQNAQ